MKVGLRGRHVKGLPKEGSASRDRRLNALAIRIARERIGLSMEACAVACGVGWPTWRKVEAGSYMPSLPLAFRMARLLGTTVDELFGGIVAEYDPWDPVEVIRQTFLGSAGGEQC